MRGRFALAMGATVLMVASLVAAQKTVEATEFTAVPEAMFRRLDGSPLALAGFRGTVVFLNFWGTWCVPCLQEIPELVRLSHQFTTQGFEVVGVAVDSGLSLL